MGKIRELNVRHNLRREHSLGKICVKVQTERKTNESKRINVPSPFSSLIGPTKKKKAPQIIASQVRLSLNNLLFIVLHLSSRGLQKKTEQNRNIVAIPSLS